MKQESDKKKLWYSIFTNPFVRDYILIAAVVAVFLYRGLSKTSLTRWDYLLISLFLLGLFTDFFLQDRKKKKASGTWEKVSVKERVRRIRTCCTQNRQAALYMVFLVILFICFALYLTHVVSSNLIMMVPIFLGPYIIIYADIFAGNTPIRNSVSKGKRLSRQTKGISVSIVPHVKMDSSYFTGFLICAAGSILCFSGLLDFLGEGIGYYLSVFFMAFTFVFSIFAWQEYLTVRYYQRNPDQYERDLALYKSFAEIQDQR